MHSGEGTQAQTRSQPSPRSPAAKSTATTGCVCAKTRSCAPTARSGIYGVVEKHDGAIILPIDGDRIWLVEQFRYTIQERALELPQGGWERESTIPKNWRAAN